MLSDLQEISYISQTASCAAALTATYSASEVESAMTGCFLLVQLIGPFAIRNRLPVVECRSSQSPAQSASEYPISIPLLDLLYFTASPDVPLRYCKIHLAAVKCVSVGLELYFYTTPTD